MPAPALDDRCPTWCREHEQDPDGLTVHQAVLGLAGPLEVTLIRWVMPDRVLSELEIRNIGNGGSGSTGPVVLPLDAEILHCFGELLDQAVDRVRRS